MFCDSAAGLLKIRVAHGNQFAKPRLNKLNPYQEFTNDLYLSLSPRLHHTSLNACSMGLLLLPLGFLFYAYSLFIFFSLSLSLSFFFCFFFLLFQIGRTVLSRRVTHNKEGTERTGVKLFFASHDF